MSLVQRRRKKLTYCCLVCSSVEEKRKRRSKDLKMTQRRNKPIATSRGKGYNERKISRHEERLAVPRRKQYDETNEGHSTTRRHGTYATKTTDNKLKKHFRSKEVFAGPWKVSIDFAHYLTPYHVLVRLPAARTGESGGNRAQISVDGASVPKEEERNNNSKSK